jgi:hypothetical protein
MSRRAVNILRKFAGDFKMEGTQIRSKVDHVKVTATCSLPARDSGKVHLVGPLAAGLAADTIITLPAAEPGLMFRFVYVGGAADAQDFQVNTGSDTNFYIGGLMQHDIGGEDGAIYHPDLNSNSRANIFTPDGGTWVEVYCDGTNWFISGWVNSATNVGVSFADQ